MSEPLISGIKYYQIMLSDAEMLAEQSFGSDWLLIVTTVPILLYILASFIEKKSFIWLSRVVFISSYSSAAYRNRSLGTNAGHTLLLASSFMGLATLAYFAENLFTFRIFGLSGFSLWGLNLLIISISVALRYILIGILGVFSGARTSFEEYGFNIAQSYKFLAIPLLFINFSVPYLEVIPDLILLILGAILIANLLIFRTIRLMTIFVNRGSSLLYMILYLCALEITPILVLAKYLRGAA